MASAIAPTFALTEDFRYMLLFFNLLLKFFSSKNSNSSQESSESYFQAFILEPILTPSAFLDHPLEGQDAADVDEFSFGEDVLLPAGFEEISWIDEFDAGVFTVGDTGEVGVEYSL